VTLENTGKGPVVNIVPSLSNTAEVNGTLAVVESPVAPCSNVLLPGQSCDEVVAFTASKDGSGEGTLSYKSALATLTINYQDGKNSKPLQQSVLAIQLDTGYVQNVLPSAASAMAFANNTLYVGTPANGLFMSSDHGTTWIDAQMFNGLSGNDVVAVSANGNQVAVATSNGIALSLDGGFDFQPQAWVAGGIPQAIAQVTSDNITTLYVGTTTGLYRGTFGGVFMPVEVVPTNVTALGIDLQGYVYAIANQVLYVKTNNSNSFVAATQVSGCAQINGVSVAWERTFFASNCGMVYVTNGASTLAKAGPAGTDLSALAVTGSNASFYGIDSAGSNVLIWNNDGNPWALNPTKNPANIIVLDSKGGYLYVGSSTGGFAIGIIDANDASKVTFP
jgi:hypothetical protein